MDVCGEHFCEIEALNKAFGSHAAMLARNHANQPPPFSSRFESILGLRQLTRLNTGPKTGVGRVGLYRLLR